MTKDMKGEGNVNSNFKETLTTIKSPDDIVWLRWKKDRWKRRIIEQDIVVFIIVSHPYQLHWWTSSNWTDYAERLSLYMIYIFITMVAFNTELSPEREGEKEKKKKSCTPNSVN